MLPFTRKRLVFILVVFCCAVFALAKLGSAGDAETCPIADSNTAAAGPTLTYTATRTPTNSATPTATASPPAGQTFIVNTTADTQDQDPGDRVCADAGGMCSLRAAITEANAVPNADTITVPSGTYTQTLVATDDDTNAGGDFDITSPMTINGAFSTATFIQASAAPNTATERVFHILSGGTFVRLNAMTIQNGRAMFTTDHGRGGGIKAGNNAAEDAHINLALSNSVIQNNVAQSRGGGLNINKGKLTVNNCIFTSNTAGSDQGTSTTSGGGAGGAIYIDSQDNTAVAGQTANITNTAILNNKAESSVNNSFGGGVIVRAINATVTFDGCQINNNRSNATNTAAGFSGFAGGLYNQQAYTIVRNSIVNGNSSSRSHAGIRNLASVDGAATLELINSTVSNNSSEAADSQGGGIGSILGGPFDSTVNIDHSTISGNTLSGGSSYGGGVMNAVFPTGGVGRLNVTNSTVSQNSAHNAGGIYCDGAMARCVVDFSTIVSNYADPNSGFGGGIYQDATDVGSTVVSNSISADNMAATSVDVNDLVTSLDYNHIENPNPAFVPAAHDAIGSDPGLGALANNGGTTQTHFPGAIVRNTIPSGTNGCGNPVNDDQRRQPRPFPTGGSCDKGAVEMGTATPTPTSTVCACTPTNTNTPTFTPTATASPTCAAAVFSNPATIVINDNASGAPYPSNITVAGLQGTVTKVTATLNGVSHTFPDDIDIMLVGPGGQNTILMSDAGGGDDITNVNLRFDDAMPVAMPDDTQISSGAFGPTNYDTTTDVFPAPAPAPGGPVAMGVFIGTDPNGTWSLYVRDDLGVDSGSISGGWTIHIETTAGCITPTPTATVTISNTPTPDGTGTPGPTPTATAVVSFYSQTFAEDESQTAAIIIRSGSPNVGAFGTFSTSNGTAVGGMVCTAGVDYISVTNQQIFFNPGEFFKTVSVITCPDGITEPDETVNLTLTGISIGFPSTAVLTVNDTATSYRSAANISIIGGASSAPYPATINVSGAPLVLGSMRVTLYDYVCSFPDDTDFLLIGPQGQNMILLADAGGNTTGGPVTLNLRDTAGAVVPDNGPLVTGDFEPTSYGTVANFPSPAATGPYHEPGGTVGGTGTQTLFGNFGGTNPNGTWSLYMRNRTLTDSPNAEIGKIAGGWGLEFLGPTAANAAISGHVMTADGRGIRHAKAVITGNSLFEPLVVTTGSFGYFTFDRLATGETYVVTVNSRRYSFSTPSRVISLVENVVDADFVADSQE